MHTVYMSSNSISCLESLNNSLTCVSIYAGLIAVVGKFKPSDIRIPHYACYMKINIAAYNNVIRCDDMRSIITIIYFIYTHVSIQCRIPFDGVYTLSNAVKLNSDWYCW